MKKIFWYILRVIGTISQSFVISYALGIIAIDVICHAYSMISALFFSSIEVDMQGVMQDTVRNILIPDRGLISSIVNDLTYGVHVALFVYTIIVVVELAIIAFFVRSLLIIVDNDKFLFVLYCITAAFSISIIVGILKFLELGIGRRFWLEIISYIVFVTLFSIICGIGNMMQSKNDLNANDL